MSNLSKETTERIEADADNYSKLFKYGGDYRKPAYSDGALHEAGRAQELVDALKLIEQMSDTGDYWIAVQRMKSIASTALAKNKEANNEPG